MKKSEQLRKSREEAKFENLKNFTSITNTTIQLICP
jgi:hypothetical protein